jgi:hypothetical protein
MPNQNQNIPTQTFQPIGNNATPTLTQNQPTGMPYGEGYGVLNDQDIPNLTRKVQYASEGNDPFSQLISGGDKLIHDANLDYGQGNINPNHYDVVNAIHDTVTMPYTLYQSRKYENERVRPFINNRNLLDSSFRDNLGNTFDPVAPLTHDSMLQQVNQHKADSSSGVNTFATDAGQMPTKDLLHTYSRTLNVMQNAARPENVSPEIIARANFMHHELARRGINMQIFNPMNRQNVLRHQADLNSELRDYNSRHPMFSEDHESFHARTNHVLQRLDSRTNTEGVHRTNVAVGREAPDAPPPPAPQPRYINAAAPPPPAARPNVLMFRAPDGSIHREPRNPAMTEAQQIGGFINAYPAYTHVPQTRTQRIAAGMNAAAAMRHVAAGNVAAGRRPSISAAAPRVADAAPRRRAAAADAPIFDARNPRPAAPVQREPLPPLPRNRFATMSAADIFRAYPNRAAMAALPAIDKLNIRRRLAELARPAPAAPAAPPAAPAGNRFAAMSMADINRNLPNAAAWDALSPDERGNARRRLAELARPAPRVNRFAAMSQEDIDRNFPDIRARVALSDEDRADLRAREVELRIGRRAAPRVTRFATMSEDEIRNAYPTYADISALTPEEQDALRNRMDEFIRARRRPPPPPADDSLRRRAGEFFDRLGARRLGRFVAGIESGSGDSMDSVGSDGAASTFLPPPPAAAPPSFASRIGHGLTAAGRWIRRRFDRDHSSSGSEHSPDSRSTLDMPLFPPDVF